ncbi:MAG TPA: PPOX class F420-dependent oxidoreductase [Trebonia sp.]|jgi:pyridoxamine 5'-phosphate oxidase family protein
MTLTDAEQAYLDSPIMARLATIGPDGGPQVKPVGCRYNAETGTVDIYGFNMASSAKYRNVQRNGQVALVADDATGPLPDGARFLEIRGVAETATDVAPWNETASEIIRVHPRRVLSVNIEPGQSGLRARDIPAAG